MRFRWSFRKCASLYGYLMETIAVILQLIWSSEASDGSFASASHFLFEWIGFYFIRLNNIFSHVQYKFVYITWCALYRVGIFPRCPRSSENSPAFHAKFVANLLHQKSGTLWRSAGHLTLFRTTKYDLGGSNCVEEFSKQRHGTKRTTFHRAHRAHYEFAPHRATSSFQIPVQCVVAQKY